MVIRQVSAWAYWSVIIGVLLPFVSFFFVKDYDYSQSFYFNALNKRVEIPFLYGQNPFECLNHSIRTYLAGPLGLPFEANYACALHTRIDYLIVLFFSFVGLLCGIYGFLHKQEMGNIWPTEWTVHSRSSVRNVEDDGFSAPNPNSPSSGNEGGGG